MITQKERNSFEVFELKNLTSDLSLITKSQQVDVVSCDAISVTFYSPKFSGSAEQLISLKGWLQFGKRAPFEFPIVGKITDLKSINDDEVQVTIKMHQYDRKIWEMFIGSLQTKQMRIDKLLNAIKGED